MLKNIIALAFIVTVAIVGYSKAKVALKPFAAQIATLKAVR